MTNKINLSPSRILNAKMLHALMTAIHQNGGGMLRKDIRDWVLKNIELSDWDMENSGKNETVRWWKFLNFISLDAYRSGLLIKDKGHWSLTEEGTTALREMDQDELYQLARDGYREWKSEQGDGEDDGSTQELNRSNISWTSPHIFHAGLGLLARAPSKQMQVDDFMQRLPKHIPDDAREDLDEYDSNWVWELGYRNFGRAARIGWLDRSAGRWTLTAAGDDAVVKCKTPIGLLGMAKAMEGKGASADTVLPYLGEVRNSGSLPQALYSTQSSTVQNLVSQVDDGSLALPDIQRPFVWKNTKVRDLLDSMYQGFPFGFILTWRSPLETRTKNIGTEDKGMSVPYSLVIDGQQRLTSLFAVMTGKEVLDKNFKKKRIQIAFHPMRGTFEVADAAIKKSPEWIPNVSAVYTNQKGTLSAVQDYLASLEKVREIGPEHRAAAEQNIQRLVNLRNTPLGILEIAQDADEEQVAEIFVRINSKGQNLKQADFILTLLAVFWEEGREQLEQFAKNCKIPSADNTASPFNRLLQPGPDDMIRVVVALGHRRARLSAAYQVLRGKSSSTGQITSEDRDKNIAVLSKAQAKALDPGSWNEFLKTLQAAGYRDSSMLPSMNSALMSYSFFLIGRHDYGLSIQELRKLIGKWFTFITISGRYSGSAETAMEEDLARLRGLDVGDGSGFIEVLENAMASELTTDFWSHTLPARLESSNIRTANSFFAAQCRLGVNALYSDLTVATLLDPERKATRKDLEIHHLFPKAWLKNNGVTNQREFNQIANQTLIEWTVNADISDKDPKVYAPDYDRDTDALTNKNHAMPAEWWNMGYEDFLAERRKMMADTICRAFARWQ